MQQKGCAAGKEQGSCPLCICQKRPWCNAEREQSLLQSKRALCSCNSVAAKATSTTHYMKVCISVGPGLDAGWGHPLCFALALERHAACLSAILSCQRAACLSHLQHTACLLTYLLDRTSTSVLLPCAMMTVYRHTAFLANVYLLLHLAQAAYFGQHLHLLSWPSLEGDY